MNSTSTYHPSFVSRNKNILVICCFLLTLLAKPIATIPMAFEDVKYELADISEKENSSKKETASENEKEPKIVSCINEYTFFIELKKQATYAAIQATFLNFNQDIQLPPPRV